MANKIAEGTFHFRCTKNPFFIFRVSKVWFFAKKQPTIWCKFEPLHFCKILDHILLTIDQMFTCPIIFINLSSKRKIYINSVGMGSNLNYMCLIVCSLFFQKIISRYTSIHFIIDPPRVLQDFSNTLFYVLVGTQRAVRISRVTLFYEMK